MLDVCHKFGRHTVFPRVFDSQHVATYTLKTLRHGVKSGHGETSVEAFFLLRPHRLEADRLTYYCDVSDATLRAEMHEDRGARTCVDV